MKRKYFIWLAPLVWIGGLALLGAVVWGLWNFTMPAVFGLPVIDYWHALALFVLSHILFHDFHFERRGGHSHFHRGRFHDRWQHMTTGERKEFIRRMRTWEREEHNEDGQAE